MSNLGFHKALDAKGIQKEITAVGDRYVVEEMRKSGYNLGGEQSGHVVIMDYNTTGDGQLTGVQLTKIMQETGKKLSELAAEVTIYPQKLVNIRVENSMKDKAMEVPAIREIIEKTLDFLPERRKRRQSRRPVSVFPGAPDRCKPGI